MQTRVIQDGRRLTGHGVTARAATAAARGEMAA